MELTTGWYLAIAVLWIGYFFLEGFDFGVGALLPVLGRDDVERRVLINTIGPVWDGNEVWLIAAVGATFAAFPEWYATLLSAFYLPMLLILVALIVRVLAFEYRGKHDSPAWRRGWDRCIVFGSVVPAVLWGMVFGNVVRGLALDGRGEYVGSVLDLANPYALLGGAATGTLFLLHGAVFLALKTRGEIRHRAAALAGRLGLGTGVVAAAFLFWTLRSHGDPVTWALAALAGLALVAALLANRARREGLAFVFSGAAIIATVATLFVALFPDVLPSTLDPVNSLTTSNAASSPYTLRIMTVAAAIFTPFVLLYQAWTYWVFRRRIGSGDIPAPAVPVPGAGG
jgi:cytochrome d ubiquinol oxidase subunit II